MRPANGIGRVANGFAAAIVTATAVAALTFVPFAFSSAGLELLMLVAWFAAVIATGHAFFVGVPAYVLLTRIWRLRWWNAMLTGAVVATGPAALVFMLPVLHDNPSSANSGLLVLAGWLAAIGAAAGFAFWWIVRERGA